MVEGETECTCNAATWKSQKDRENADGAIGRVGIKLIETQLPNIFPNPIKIFCAPVK